MTQPESFPGLHAWLDTPLGRYVMNWEAARFDVLVADIFGYNAVQLGVPELDLLRANRMPFRFRAGTGDVSVEADYAALPFAAGSVDLVVLPGSRATLADLDWLHGLGLADALRRRARASGPTINRSIGPTAAASLAAWGSSKLPGTRMRSI